jgi:hypothetical protein
MKDNLEKYSRENIEILIQIFQKVLLICSIRSFCPSPTVFQT